MFEYLRFDPATGSRVQPPAFPAERGRFRGQQAPSPQHALGAMPHRAEAAAAIASRCQPAPPAGRPARNCPGWRPGRRFMLCLAPSASAACRSSASSVTNLVMPSRLIGHESNLFAAGRHRRDDASGRDLAGLGVVADSRDLEHVRRDREGRGARRLSRCLLTFMQRISYVKNNFSYEKYISFIRCCPAGGSGDARSGICRREPAEG
jgi:hypothetical protein